MKKKTLQYRIRTEEEFIKKFGPYWRNRVQAGWNSNMDRLIGRILQHPLLEKEFGWTISPDMIVPIENQVLRYIIKPCDCDKYEKKFCPNCRGSGEITIIVAENDNK